MRKVYSKIESISGNVITVTADGVKYEDLAEVSSAHGKSLAKVIKLDGDKVALQVLQGAEVFQQGMKFVS